MDLSNVPLNVQGVFFVSDEVGKFPHLNNTRMISIRVVDEEVIVDVRKPWYYSNTACGQYVVEDTFNDENMPEIFRPLVDLYLGRLREELAAKTLSPFGIIKTPQWLLPLQELYVESHVLSPGVRTRLLASTGHASLPELVAAAGVDNIPKMIEEVLQASSTRLPGKQGWLAPMELYTRQRMHYAVHPFFGTPAPKNADELWYFDRELGFPIPRAVRVDRPHKVRVDMLGFVGQAISNNPAWRYLQEAELIPRLKSRFKLKDEHMERVRQIMEVESDDRHRLMTEFVACVPEYYRPFLRQGDIEMALQFPGEFMSVTDAPTLQLCTTSAKPDTSAISIGEPMVVSGNAYV